MTYFNEYDAYPAQWLRNLWPEAHVDARSIADVQSDDVSNHERVHFFAGIGGWEYALQLAGWTGPVWTGSCPCQPFSTAGKQKGTADERHIWPEFRRLISQCRPPVIFGEQVASRLGREWLAGVRADLEAMGYAVGAADLCAAGVGAPHIRQRLYWVANSIGGGPTRISMERQEGVTERGRMGNTGSQRLAQRIINGGVQSKEMDASPWETSQCSSVQCSDGKERRIPSEPSLFPLANGVSNRVGRLRAYGNAIVPQVAAAFIRAFMESR